MLQVFSENQHQYYSGTEIAEPSSEIDVYDQKPYRNRDIRLTEVISDIDSYYVAGKLQQLVLHFRIPWAAIESQVETAFGYNSHDTHEDHVAFESFLVFQQVFTSVHDH